jgi:hypothetical protein
MEGDSSAAASAEASPALTVDILDEMHVHPVYGLLSERRGPSGMQAAGPEGPRGPLDAGSRARAAAMGRGELAFQLRLLAAQFGSALNPMVSRDPQTSAPVLLPLTSITGLLDHIVGVIDGFQYHEADEVKSPPPTAVTLLTEQPGTPQGSNPSAHGGRERRSPSLRMDSIEALSLCLRGRGSP